MRPSRVSVGFAHGLRVGRRLRVVGKSRKMIEEQIPETDVDFDQWQNRWMRALAGRDSTGIGVEPIQDAQAHWNTAYNSHLAAQSAAQSSLKTKNDARTTYVELIHSYMDQIHRLDQKRDETEQSEHALVVRANLMLDSDPITTGAPESTTPEFNQHGNEADSRKSPRRIGGWLIIPAIGLIVSPFMNLAVIRENFDGFQSSVLDDVVAVYPGFHDLFVFDTAVGLITFGLLIYIAIVFFLRRAYVPRLIISYFCFHLIAAVVSAAWYASIFGELDPLITQELARAAVSAALWIPYFLVSKRVKETFVR